MTVELDRAERERSLERAARRLSQRYDIPGFRRGRAPRVIVERFVGRAGLMSEAAEEMVQLHFRAALKQESIEPVAQPTVHEVQIDSEPYHFVVDIPVPPTVELGDYRSIRLTVTPDIIDDETFERHLASVRERHVVLRQPEAERAAQPGDQVQVELETFVDGKAVDQRDADTPVPGTTLVLEPERLAPGLCDGIVGLTPGQAALINAQMPSDYHDASVAGRAVTFAVKVLEVKERILPEWDELPALEKFDGDPAGYRDSVRADLERRARQRAERTAIDAFVEQLVACSTVDVPDVLVRREAERAVARDEQQYARYGVKPEHVYEMQGRTRESVIDAALPDAERTLITNLVMQQLIDAEELYADATAVTRELDVLMQSQSPEQWQMLSANLGEQVYRIAASQALDRRLSQWIFANATEGAYVPLSAEAPTEAEAAVEAEAPTEAEAAVEADGAHNAASASRTE